MILISEGEVRALFDGVRSEAFQVVPMDVPQRVYTGDVRYCVFWSELSHFWEVTLFVDCNAFEHVERVRDPGIPGRADCLVRVVERTALEHIEFSDEEAWRLFRIPGYLHFRCEACSAELEAVPVVAAAEDHRSIRCEACGGMHFRPEVPCPVCGREKFVDLESDRPCIICRFDEIIRAGFTSTSERC